MRNDNLNKTLVIHHHPCTDGFTAAWCFWQHFGHNIEYHPGVYGEAPPDVTGKNVFLVDFSYKRDVVLQMAETAASITIIDHHKTATDDLEGIDEECTGEPAHEGGDVIYCKVSTYFDNNRSGAGLAWDWLNPGTPRPALINHVEDRDLWRFKLPLTREIGAALFSYEQTFEQWDLLMKADINDLVREGTALERKHMKDVRANAEITQRRMVIGGINVPCANVPHSLASDVGHLLGENAPFAACYVDTVSHRRFSLRSRPDGADVSAVAKQYGGGGHQHAAGFEVPRDHALAKA